MVVALKEQTSGVCSVNEIEVGGTEAQPGCSYSGQGETEVAGGQDSVTGEFCNGNVGNEDEEMFDDGSLSQFSDTVSQDDPHPQSYTLKEISDFLDESYGRQDPELTDFFPDVDMFIHESLQSGGF